jgi:DNA-directed RNA polymerase specialized sigma24 family protein
MRQVRNEHGQMSVDAMTNPEEWVDRHGDGLYRYALLRLRSPDLAADVVQETFLEAIRARSSSAGSSSERAWLVGILRPIRYVGLRRLGAVTPFSWPDCPIRIARIPDLFLQSLDRQAVDLLDEFPDHRSESFHQGPGLFELAASGKVFEV